MPANPHAAPEPAADAPPPAPTPAPAPTEPAHAGAPALGMGPVAAAWLPLAGSWLLMGLELPAVAAVMARLPHATVSLAAYGGVVFPLALLVESPILMLLTASTALARGPASYAVVRRFMWLAGGGLTALHFVLAFTPLFDWVAGALIGVPEPVREPARTGLRIMLPWTMAIAYRRTQQGVLIRFRRPRAVTWGTLVRLATLASVLALGASLGALPGIVVGTGAVAAAVVAEAVFARLAVGPVLRGPLAAAAGVEPPLSFGTFVRFYTPLALTPLLNFIAMPLAAAAMSRMPNALESLAVWPVLAGAVFAVRSAGFAYNEVVVALLDRPAPLRGLRRFAWVLTAGTTAALAAGAITPLGRLWFERGSALPPGLAALAGTALLWLVPMGAVSVWQSFHQGLLVHAHRTRAVTEAMLLLLLATAAVLGIGVAWRAGAGLHVAALGMTAGGLAQVAWLAHRSGAVRRAFARAPRPGT